MKQVILDSFLINPGDISWAPIEEIGDVVIHTTTTRDQLAERIGDAQIVYSNRPVIKREVFEQCPNLRYIGLFSTGYNTVDLAAADEYGVTVCNVPSYSTYAVAQSTIALLLEIVNNTSRLSAHVKGGGWRTSEDTVLQSLPLQELYGKTMGIIGFGEIGRVVADIALALGMQVLYHRRNPDPSVEKPGIAYATLDELAANSDVISLHCPLTDQTRGLINAEFLAKVQPGAILLNTARGPILNEQDVAAALDSGVLYGVGVDVLSREPAPLDNPLLKHPRCVVTPHVGWTPKETRARLVERAAANAKAFLAGTPTNVVNHPGKKQ